MRHLVKGSKLGRTAAHRKATLTALAIALIHERRITTTLTKAKALRGFIEPLITRAKEDTMHNRRLVFAKLQDKYAVTELFEEVGPEAKDRPGGYTRVLKLGFRAGDAADMAVIELVDYNDVPPEVQGGKKKRTRRAGRSRKTTSSGAAPQKQQESTEKGTERAEEQSAAAAATEQTETPEAPETGEASTAEEQTNASGETSADFTVDEVKEKMESMSLEEAKQFAGDDERVTVQQALERKSQADSNED